MQGTGADQLIVVVKRVTYDEAGNQSEDKITRKLCKGTSGEEAELGGKIQYATSNRRMYWKRQNHWTYHKSLIYLASLV